MLKIGDQLLNRVSDEARKNVRQRKHHNFHGSYQEPVQRLVNAIEPGSYIRPHMHKDPDKLEIFFVLRGKLLVIEFETDGKIKDSCVLDTALGQYGVEIYPGSYHMVVGLEPETVAYEVKNGPFDPGSDKRFAPWAPEEGSEEGKRYLQQMIDNILGEY